MTVEVNEKEELGMNYHQACRLINMQVVPLGSTINGKTVTALLIVPQDPDGIVQAFNEWLEGKTSTSAYQQYDGLQVLVVLDDCLAYSLSLQQALTLIGNVS